MNRFAKSNKFVCAFLLTVFAFTRTSLAQQTERIDLSQVTDSEIVPEVRSLLESPGERSQMGLDYLKYAEALLAGGDALDEMVDRNVRLNDLEPLGFRGLTGLKEFRRQRNAAFSYDRSVITNMRFPEREIIEVDICTERTDTNTGAKRIIVIHARNKWVNRKLVERWDGIEELSAESDCGPPQ